MDDPYIFRRQGGMLNDVDSLQLHKENQQRDCTPRLAIECLDPEDV
jgi:hypothetical protein